MERTRSVLLAAAVAACAGCGARQAVPEGHWEKQLAQAIGSQVASREQNLQNSRAVEQALAEGALEDMMRFQVQSAIGRGEPCHAHPECAENGFLPDDLFYTVGSGDEERIGKLPVLVVGFGNYGRVVRTWNLRVH